MRQDHRIRLTKMLVRDSFLGLLQEKPVAKITVKELCEDAGINRATFYAHYHDIFSLYEEIETELAQTIMESLGSAHPQNSLDAFCNDICSIIVDNKQSCQAILGEHGDPEFPARIVETLRSESIALWKAGRPDATLEDLDRFYTFMANGCLAVVRAWVQDDMVQDQREIASFIQKMMSGGLDSLR